MISIYFDKELFIPKLCRGQVTNPGDYKVVGWNADHSIWEIKHTEGFMFRPDTDSFKYLYEMCLSDMFSKLMRYNRIDLETVTFVFSLGYENTYFDEIRVVAKINPFFWNLNKEFKLLWLQ